MTLSMMEPFAVEQWMDSYESTARYNIAETCAAPISLDDLKALSEDESHDKSHDIFNPSTKLNYGALRGTQQLRDNLAGLYSSKSSSPIHADDILITPGAIAANLIALYGLVGRGDHVICHYPTWQQLYQVPASLGAEVDLWRAREDKQWQLDIGDLKALIRPNTKMIIINNPNNPTGAIIPKSTLYSLVDLAKTHDLIIFSDEVYRPIFHSVSPLSPEFPPSVLSLPYTKSLVTGSLSKAYSLAGIRVGWIGSRSPEIIAACIDARHYTCLSVSQVDDQIAAFALNPSCVHNLLGRNISLARRNLEIVEAFVKKHAWACEWSKPVAGTTTFVKFSRGGKEVDDVELCQQLLDKAGVLFCPGSMCFGGGKDFKGYVRMGFVCETEILIEGLEQLGNFMRNDYGSIALAKGAVEKD